MEFKLCNKHGQSEQQVHRPHDEHLAILVQQCSDWSGNRAASTGEGIFNNI